MENFESFVTVRPSRLWWVAWAGLALACTCMFSAWFLGIVCILTDWKPGLPGLLWVWGGLMVIVLAWVLRPMARQMTWTLTANDLRQGKRRPKVIFRFDEIEFIVIGVPVRAPRLPLRILPAVRWAWELRCTSIVVRLHGGRRILLNFLSKQFLNGHLLLERFVRLHEAKVVGSDTYTDQELRKMQRAGLNRIFSV